MAHCVWTDAGGNECVTYFVEGLSDERKAEVLAKLIRDGRMPAQAGVVHDGPIPVSKPVGKKPTLEDRVAALEVKSLDVKV